MLVNSYGMVMDSVNYMMIYSIGYKLGRVIKQVSIEHQPNNLQQNEPLNTRPQETPHQRYIQ